MIEEARLRSEQDRARREAEKERQVRQAHAEEEYCRILLERAEARERLRVSQKVQLDQEKTKAAEDARQKQLDKETWQAANQANREEARKQAQRERVRVKHDHLRLEAERKAKEEAEKQRRQRERDWRKKESDRKEKEKDQREKSTNACVARRNIGMSRTVNSLGRLRGKGTRGSAASYQTPTLSPPTLRSRLWIFGQREKVRMHLATRLP